MTLHGQHEGRLSLGCAWPASGLRLKGLQHALVHAVEEPHGRQRVWQRCPGSEE